MLEYLSLFGLAFANNAVFALVSRSRNRNNMTYHAIASVLSNMIWFMTMDKLIQSEFTWDYGIPYTAGTVIGSVLGAKLSMRIEKLFNIKSDEVNKN